ncbi:MAG: 7-carboxy-7-deazaguanine synthase QueE [Muribaculaceae bacterium]|nr:7-carboxy-7-deazaguanine synthase QueE [Muribaculaceae bacterium]
MRKIKEIFHSIQGEGCLTGVSSVFIRFSGCNLKCEFCDTKHDDGVWMSDDEILNEVKKYKAAMVVLTGGEPSLFIDEEFVERLKEETLMQVAIETNGTRPLPQNLDWVTVSPKIGMSHTGDATIAEGVIADEVKVVDVGQDLFPYLKLQCVGANTRMLLQPCYVPDKEEWEKNTRRTIRRVLDNPSWSLSLQTHRYLGIQ